MARTDVRRLVLTPAAHDKLGARSIGTSEVRQHLSGRSAVTPNVRGSTDDGVRARRRLMVGTSAGGRVLTLVIEATADPGTWTVVTGWESVGRERRLLGPR